MRRVQSERALAMAVADRDAGGRPVRQNAGQRSLLGQAVPHGKREAVMSGKQRAVEVVRP